MNANLRLVATGNATPLVSKMFRGPAHRYVHRACREGHIRLFFDNLLSTPKLDPAAKGRRAVLDDWTDSTGAHDKKVLEVEEAMLQENDVVSGHMVRQSVD